jgi:cell surface protein SprA
VGIQHTETSGTSLPGYLDSTKFLGQNWKSMQPGFDFIFGYQPDTNWINQKGLEGVLTKDPRFNSLIQQRYDQRLNLSALVTPVRNLTIDVNMDKTFSKNYSELFKDTSAFLTEGFKRLNPYSLVVSASVTFLSRHYSKNLIRMLFQEHSSSLRKTGYSFQRNLVKQIHIMVQTQHQEPMVITRVMAGMRKM